MIPNDPAPPSAPEPFLVPLPEAAALLEVPPPAATAQSTVQLVLTFLAVFGTLCFVGVFVLLLIIVKAVLDGRTDDADLTFLMAAIAVLSTPGTAAIGVVGGSLINTRTPQP